MGSGLGLDFRPPPRALMLGVDRHYLACQPDGSQRPDEQSSDIDLVPAQTVKGGARKCVVVVVP
jgi:hypothetical protein